MPSAALRGVRSGARRCEAGRRMSDIFGDSSTLRGRGGWRAWTSPGRWSQTPRVTPGSRQEGWVALREEFDSNVRAKSTPANLHDLGERLLSPQMSLIRRPAPQRRAPERRPPKAAEGI